MFNSAFWTPLRTPGAILVVGSLLPAFIAIGVALFGKVRAAEAMFRDIDAAVGHVNSFRVTVAIWPLWVLVSLAGFVLLALVLLEAGYRALPVLATVAFSIFATTVIIEAAFHLGVTSWAIRQAEQGIEVPALFDELKRWLNVSMQIIANPLATLSFVGFGIVLLRGNMVWSPGAWFVIVWSALTTFFPLPLAFGAMPLLMGILLIFHR